MLLIVTVWKDITKILIKGVKSVLLLIVGNVIKMGDVLNVEILSCSLLIAKNPFLVKCYYNRISRIKGNVIRDA